MPLNGGIFVRSVADSNCCPRFCRPIPNHSGNRPCAFDKSCYRMALCAIKRTIAFALPKTNLAIAFGDPKENLAVLLELARPKTAFLRNANAKVQYFFEICKYFCKKVKNNCNLA